ncbi:unnamed protein product [Rotaria sp. Silwood1]|nr:unnamed protein product [Rotaria sp. Silwood1]CAF3480370.1 unnamed protein product [Rotaria sp. Silwood1]CAF4520580.1 unnamed protein product [Rotaria sp. Silwood1]CAF4549440.1 unnamed protein product [Rotaria sp. Silwood1]
MFVIVHGQLSIDELFFFNSKHTLNGDCNDFQYTFTNIRINSYNYNQFILNCNLSSIIFRNKDYISSSICPNDEDYFQNFRIRFRHLSQTFIQVNHLPLYGIELCSLDDLIRSRYDEYSYYRSERALLINLENNNRQEKQHLAIATNGEMTFILFILSQENDEILVKDDIELVFPKENIFKFNRSSIDVWRVDQSYVRSPSSLRISSYQLSKSKFTLFDNETFFLYGTQISNPRRFRVSIDETPVKCSYDYILQCTFPILPWNVLDIHQPMLRVIYHLESIFNATLTLLPRTRLHYVPTNHSVTDIGSFEVNIDENLCANNSLKSLFTFIIHLWKEDTNGTERYQEIVNDDIGPVDCNRTAEIGQDIEKVMQPISLDDITSMSLDLTHRWYDHQNCRAESTRITFN